MDLRIKKTHKALISALFRLLESRPFDKITVNDLCGEALVSRSTFYDHYQDKYDLLQTAMDSLRANLWQEFTQGDFREGLKRQLKWFYDNRRILKNIASSGQNEELQAMAVNSFDRDIESLFEKEQINESSLVLPKELFAAFYSAGMTNLIKYWLEHEDKYTLDEMVDYFIHLFPEKNLLGL